MTSYQPAEPELADAVAQLRRRDPLPALVVPKPWRPWDAELQRRLTGDWPAAASGERGRSLQAGLLLWDDALGESHTVAQSLTTPTGSYWHGIMHRREGDFDNAAHWFRRTGEHPAFGEVFAAATAVAAGTAGPAGQECAHALRAAGRWDPFAFAGWCEAAPAAGADRRALLERIQVAEMEVLLAFCDGQLPA